MSRNSLLIVCLLAVCTSPLFAGVTVNTPANNSTYQGSVPFKASATSSTCDKGVSSIGIYTAPGVLAYVVNGSSLNTSLNLSPGTYNTDVQEWDNCGGAAKTPITVKVTAGGTGVHVTSPANNSSVGSSVNFTATATTSCSKGISAMGIYTAPSQLAYVVNGASMNHDLSLGAGTYHTVVEEWDNCGGAATTPITISVNGSGGGGGGNTFTSIQSAGQWEQAGQVAPTFVDCSPSPCDGIKFSMNQGVSSPSMSGNATQFYLGGSTAYGDALFDNHLIGPMSSQGMPDKNQTLVPTLHDFTYDLYFFGDNLGASEALEFDINQFFDGMGFIWGHECRIAGGNEWDVWDNQSGHWVATGIPCYPNNNAWNHVTITVERNSNNQLVYKSITLNGNTQTLNWTYGHGSAPGSWYGVTINYQQDGNYKQTPYDIYLDKVSFTYQ
jgi:hypothetical protein